MKMTQFYVTKEGMIPVGSNRFAALSDDFVIIPEVIGKEEKKDKKDKKDKKESKK
jgi:hypothetical protein